MSDSKGRVLLADNKAEDLLGYIVDLLNATGYETRCTRESDPAVLSSIVLEFMPTAIVMDIHWSESEPRAGIEILRAIHDWYLEHRCPIFVWTQITEDWLYQELGRLDVPRERVFYRLRDHATTLVQAIDRFAADPRPE